MHPLGFGEVIIDQNRGKAGDIKGCAYCCYVGNRLGYGPAGLVASAGSIPAMSYLIDFKLDMMIPVRARYNLESITTHY